MTEKKGEGKVSEGAVSESRARSARERSGGGPASPAVAALRMEPLSLWVLKRVEAFPRSHKFTVGDRLIETCLEAQTSLVEASYVRDKRGLLLGASRALVRGRVLARLATALHALSVDQEAHFARESTEIGRMVGGWLRALNARQAAARAPAQQGVGAGGAA